MLNASRAFLLMCGFAVCAGLVLAGPVIVDRVGMIHRHLTHRTDGLGQAPSYAPCAEGNPWLSESVQESCHEGDALASQVGSHVLLWHEDGAGPSVANTPPINTQASGSTLIAFSAGYTSNNQGPTDNKGNTWAPLGAPVVYRGYDGQFNVKAYIVNSAVGGNGHSLSIVKNGAPSGEITVPFIEIRNSAALHAVAQNYPAAASVVSSASVTTSGPATLVTFWWGDASGLVHSAIPNNGFSIIENFVNLPPNSAVQCVVAVRQVAGAGTYNVSWTQTPSQGAVLWLMAFQSDDAIFESGFE